MADNKLYEILGVTKNATDSEIKKVNSVLVINGLRPVHFRIPFIYPL